MMDVREVDARLTVALLADEPAVDAGDLPPHEVSPLQGRMLELLARMCGARRILELGTLAGYSTLWLARALPPDGELVTIEANPAHAALARANLAGDERITLVEADALGAIADLTGTFDLLFLDAEKRSNAAYLDGVLPRTRPGTVIVADNVIRHDGPPDFYARLSEVADATVIQTTGAKGHDGFALAIVR
jgi:predicted O-methyltransferase YrrM